MVEKVYAYDDREEKDIPTLSAILGAVCAHHPDRTGDRHRGHDDRGGFRGLWFLSGKWLKQVSK